MSIQVELAPNTPASMVLDAVDLINAHAGHPKVPIEHPDAPKYVVVVTSPGRPYGQAARLLSTDEDLDHFRREILGRFAGSTGRGAADPHVVAATLKLYGMLIYTWRDYVVRMMDQGSFNSCVALFYQTGLQSDLRVSEGELKGVITESLAFLA